MGLWWPTISWVTNSRFARWLAAAVAGAALGLGLLWKLRRSIRATVELENKVDVLEGAIAADKRMDHADIGHGDADDDRNWLRDYAERRGEPRS